MTTIAWLGLTMLQPHMQLLKLRAALNEKDLELIELREQHVQLVVRSLLMHGYMATFPCTRWCMNCMTDDDTTLADSVSTG